MEREGIQNTLRFQVLPGYIRKVSLEFLVQDLLQKSVGVELRHIFCIQDHAAPRYYDVSFVHSSLCMDVFEKCRELEKANNESIRPFIVEPLYAMEEKPLVVHLFNPFTDIALVVAFLRRYCSSVKGGFRLTNRLGIFNSKLKFFVKLKVEPGGIGGVCHPPANFSIAGNRGFLFYPGQPAYCRKCFSFGHTREDCNVEKRCRNCGEEGHEAGACLVKRACDVCGQRDHTVKNCSKVRRAFVSYAEAVKRTSESGRPVSTQVLSDSPERQEEEVEIEDKESGHLEVEERAEEPTTSAEPVLVEDGVEVEREVEEPMENLTAALQWEPEVQDAQEVEEMETMGAKTKVDSLDSPKQKKAKKFKVETPGFEISNPFEVLAVLGAEVEKESSPLSPGSLDSFQPAMLSPSLDFLDDESVVALNNVCHFSGTGDETGGK